MHGSSTASISVDRLFEELPWDGGSERLFRRANRSVIRSAIAARSRGRMVVVDGHFYWATVLDEPRRALGPAT